MRNAAVAAGVDVPFKVLAAHAKLVDALLQLLQGGFTLASADYFSNLGEEDVHAADGAAIGILLHVEGLDVLGEVDEDNGLLEMFFYQVTFVLALEVCAPVDGILELDAIGHGLFQNLHGLCVSDSLELYAQDTLHALDEAVVVFVVEELEVVHAVIEGVFHQVLDKLFCKFHVVVDVVEGHFRLNHPELCKVTRGVGILCAEGGAEGVDFAYCGCTKFTLQLAGHGEACLLAKEVFAEVHVSLLVQGDVLEVHCGYLEHVSCALSIGLSDERSVEIDKALVVEELVDGKSHGVADAQDGAEGVGPEAHVRYAAEILKGCILFLEGETHWVALSQDFNLGCLDFHGLAAAH